MIRRTSAVAGMLAATVLAAGCQEQDGEATNAAPAAGDRAAQIERGRYLVAVMDCNGCHTPGALAGKPDAQRALGGGDIGFEAPGLGVFYPPNLTPHPGADISKWSEADIVKVVRTGERPDGRVLVPIMPWPAYSHLTDADAAALAAYLKSLQPIAAPVLRPSAPERAPAPYLTVKMPAGGAAPPTPGAGQGATAPAGAAPPAT